MGHDLEMRRCPSPPDSDCINACHCDHYCETKTGLSFNFTKYSEYWYVGQAHGHKGSVIARQIQIAIDQLDAKYISYTLLDDQDGWSSDLNVFHHHLRRLLRIMLKYPDCTMLSDQIGTFMPDPDTPDPKVFSSDN
jgi:hypothetical protein